MFKGELKGFVVGVTVTSILLMAPFAMAQEIRKTIDVMFNSVNLTVNGQKVQAENILYNGTTYVPLRATAELLGREVGWDANSRTASINDKNYIEPKIETIETINYNDGSKYIGYVKNNQRYGYGKLYDRAGILSIEGDWKNDLLDGNGMVYYDNGNKLYEGSFKEGTWNGYGKAYWQSGKLFYDGQWLDNQCHGLGKGYNENGSLMYEGEYANGVYNGKGKLYWESGSIMYSGEFKNGMLHGNGKAYFEDGTMFYNGEWQNGEPLIKDLTPIATLPLDRDIIESRIDGTFEGWSGDTIFKLQNGEIWQQTSFAYKYSYKYAPKVLIYKSGYTYKMKVDGVDGEISVKQLK